MFKRIFTFLYCHLNVLRFILLLLVCFFERVPLLQLREHMGVLCRGFHYFYYLCILRFGVNVTGGVNTGAVIDYLINLINDAIERASIFYQYSQLENMTKILKK